MSSRSSLAATLSTLSVLAGGCALSPLSALSPPTTITPPSEPDLVAPPVAGCTVMDGRADTTCTPGVTNPAVTQATIRSTICRRGWTATIRPPQSYTSGLKRQGVVAYNEPPPLSLYEEDHLISLELGGDPRDPKNLWPQPYAGPRGAKLKDQQEDTLKAAVCAHSMTLADAQAKLLADWTHPPS